MKKRTRLHRLLSWMIAVAITLTTVLTGYVPISAETASVISEQDVTLTVIGDTADHSLNPGAHTGYIYWVKNVPLNVSVEDLSDNYIAKNCSESIKAVLAEHKITAHFFDETSLYAESFTKDNVTLESDYTKGGYWSVMVAYADGTFSSDGWGEYSGAAVLKPGCRLIYYWSDNMTNDCRVSTDENYNTTLNYDTDAVTGISLYTDTEEDSTAKYVSCEVGQVLNLTAKLTVPAASAVDRTLTWKSSDETVAKVESVKTGAKVTAVSAGTTEIQAYLKNTLGETIEAVCTLTVTDDGTTITNMSFEEGDTLCLEPGDVASLTPVFTPELTQTDSAPYITWSTSDDKVVGIDEKTGDFEAFKPGESVITATITNNKGAKVSASCTVMVEKVPVTGIAVDKSSLSMTTSETRELSIRFIPGNATEIPNITWESDNEEVASVIGNGAKSIVTAMNGGTAVITAKAGDMTASCEVTVTAGKEIIRLTDLVFAKDKNGETVYTMQTKIDPVTKECTVIIPENVNSFYLKPISEEGETVTIQAQYQNFNFTKELTKDLEPGTFTQFSGTTRALQSDQAARDLRLVVTEGTWTQTYTVHMVRESLVSSLHVTDKEGTKLIFEPEFSNTTREYELTVVDTIDSVNIEFAANNAGSTSLTVNDEPAKDGKYTLALTDAETTAVIRAGNDTVIPAEYILKVKRVTAGKYSFAVSPKDAVVSVLDSNNIRQWGENHTFSILPGETYTYTVSKAGYIAQTGTFTGSGTQSVTLEKAPEQTYKQFETDWSGLRNDKNNQGITDASTPISSDATGLKWERQYGEGYSNSAVSSQIIVDNKIYCYSASRLLVLSKETGEILKSAAMAGSSSFAINPPSYANGMIFVGLSSGRIQAFNADTLESLWVYTDPLGGQPNCSIRYDNGYVYTGFWNSETKDASWVCVSVTDEDPTRENEAKAATWTYQVPGGFYWAGAYTNEKYLIVGSDDGEAGYDSETSFVYVFDKYTGKLMQKIGPCIGDIRSDISYYNGRIYFTTKAGYLYSYNLTEDGLIDMDNLIAPIQPGAMSTSTPVVYNNRAYIGVTHGSNFSGTYGIEVIDINPESGEMSLAYEVPTTGYPQTSGMLTTAYEKETGYVYVYFTVNSANAEMYIVKDKAGMTQADEDSGVLYVPNHKQYCICSIVADKSGTMFFKNDSAYMMALSKNEITANDVIVSGGNAAFYGEESFQSSVLNHEIVVDPGTQNITLSMVTNDEIAVYMNEVPGDTQQIELKDGKAVVEVLLISGNTSGSYYFKIRERSSDASLADILVSSSSVTTSAVSLLPAFEADTKEYRANYYKTAASLYAWAMPVDENAAVTAEIISGAAKIQSDMSGGYLRSRVYFEDTQNYETPAVVKFVVTAEDGVTTKGYFVTLGFDTAAAEMRTADPAVLARRPKTVQIAFTTNQPGKLYYVISEEGHPAPTLAEVKKGASALVKEGENTAVLEGLSENDCDIFMVFVGYANSATDVISLKADAYDRENDLYLAHVLDEKIAEMLGGVEITLEYKEDIEALRAEYDGLSEVQKGEVKNLPILEASEKRIEQIEKELADAEAAAKALAEAKAAAKEMITEYKSADDYRDAQKAELEKAIKDAHAAIDAAKSIDEVKEAEIKAKEVMDAIKTDEQLTKEEDALQLPYEDVAETDWFYRSVAYTYHSGLMTGMDATHFGPYGQLSRAQFALILYRMEEEPFVETDKTFKDIFGNEWYTQAVLWAAEHGIVTGYLDGNFGPADLITREQMAVMMYRYANYLALGTSDKADYSSFADADKVSGFAEVAMGWVTGSGIITGKDNGTILDPQGNTARSETAVIIQRFMTK